MDGNGDSTFTDRYSAKRASQAWEEASPPIVRFRTDDGVCWGFQFHHLDHALTVKLCVVDRPAIRCSA